VDVVVQRCAEVGVHKDTRAAYVRPPGPGGERYREARRC
jgi:hypothetical protein